MKLLNLFKLKTEKLRKENEKNVYLKKGGLNRDFRAQNELFLLEHGYIVDLVLWMIPDKCFIGKIL